ncbi:MAG: T9SS type A sorting domain-containing protein [Sphingobacteriaceae bacterium]|nr:T9SS type A sorting domain-containing protein [Sphingobacteriaceae bacterium]
MGITSFFSFGQTNPTAHSLSASNFTFTGFGDGTSTTYPTSIQGHSFSAERTSSNLTDNATADRVLVANSTTITTGSIRNEVANGISLLNSGTNNIGAIVVSLNASGRTGLKVTFTAEQLTSGFSTGSPDRVNGVRLQYRIGTSGSFTNVANTEYLTTSTASLNAAQTFTEIELPSACNNEPIVHLRWVYYISSGTANSRDRIRLDDITVTSLASASPTIITNTVSLSGFTAITGSSSASQNFTVRATNVTERVVLTAPAGFQVSRDNVTFQDTVHTAFVVDSVPTQTIHVRQNSATLGTSSGNISCTSAGATAVNVALSGVVLSTQPSTQPSLSIGAITASTIELTVGNTGGLSNWIILAKEGSAVDGEPVDGTDYTPNATFSSGAIINTNNRVVLKGNGTSVTVTVPNPATTYHFAIFAYNDGGVSASTNYNPTTPGTANATTLSVPLGWQINATNTVFSINFDATVDNVNNGSFAAASTFGAANPAAGQLNSNAWAYSANSSGAATFGGNLSSGFGISTGGVTSSGAFAFEVATGNIALGIQPTGTVFSTGGNFTLRIQNKTGATLNNAQLSYILWVNNNEARSTTIAFSHSTDNSTYTSATDASYSSVLASQGSVLWVPQYFSISLSGLNVAADGFLYLRWSGTDNGGTGSRDEFAIDDINFIAERSTATLATSGNFDNVLVDGNVSLSAASSISGTLNLKSGVLNTGGNLTLKSTAANVSANVINGTNSSINGNVTVERFLPWASANNSGFRFVSHPLASNPVINTVTNLPTATNTVIGYNEGSNAYEGISNRAGTWPQGIGYGVWNNAANTISFTGALQLSDVAAISMGNATQRWNFAGNPFASVLDWDAVTRTDMQNAVWVWVKDDVAVGGGAWASYIDGVAANGGSRYIAPMQGFMVRALASGTPSLAYPAAARVSGQTPSYQRTQAAGDIYRVKVTNTTNNSAIETVIRFRANATENHDAAYDAEFVTDYFNGTPDLYTSDANGVKYSINSLPELTAAAVVVPLQLETFGAGSFNFTFDAAAMLTSSRVQLEDRRFGSFTDLVDGQVVSITVGSNEAVDRFRLHFNSTGATTSVNNQQNDLIQIYTNEGALYIRGIEQAQSLRILDISGRTVYLQQQLSLDGNALRPNLAKGTYVVQLVSGASVKTVKVIF